MIIRLDFDKAENFVTDNEGRLRTPMFFEKLNEIQKRTYLKILRHRKPIRDENFVKVFNIDVSKPRNYIKFLDAIKELCFKKYIYFEVD